MRIQMTDHHHAESRALRAEGEHQKKVQALEVHLGGERVKRVSSVHQVHSIKVLRAETEKRNRQEISRIKSQVPQRVQELQAVHLREVHQEVKDQRKNLRPVGLLTHLQWVPELQVVHHRKHHREVKREPLRLLA